MDMYETETGNPAPTVLPMLYGKWRHPDQPKHFFLFFVFLSWSQHDSLIHFHLIYVEISVQANV